MYADKTYCSVRSEDELREIGSSSRGSATDFNDQSLSNQCTIDINGQSSPSQPTIDISDLNHEVVLLDISSDKEWMAYITYKTDTTASPIKKSMFITRRRFTVMDKITETEELDFSGNPLSASNTDHISFEITEYVKDGGLSHCKFLSISHDGKYVVLSFFEIYKNNITKKPGNPNCLIFEMKKEVKEPRKIKCQGRAVFLNQNYSLAIISSESVKIYDNFPENEHVTSTFDLLPFCTTDKQSKPAFENHESFIQKASWLDISKKEIEDEIKKVITISRHIRHNLLTTPLDRGVVRFWSIKNGARLTSLCASNQHVMAFSKDYKYAAAYSEETRSINIYNIKSSTLVYELKSRETSDTSNFTVSHIRFCYDGKYVAMAGWEGDDVVFEVWNMETEKSIYRKTEELVTEPTSNPESPRIKKVIQPFVSRRLLKEKKCLKGYYMTYSNGRMVTMCVELDIDGASDNRDIEWESDRIPFRKCKYEIGNSLRNHENLRCGNIRVGKKNYLIRFGKHTVQLWDAYSEGNDNGLIKEEDKLLYIRAYKGPDYGIGYSFRETWKIRDFNSIKFIRGDPFGRLLVNIEESTDEIEDEVISTSYHTEEIFLPLDELLPSSTSPLLFDCHKFESACQALHFLFKSNGKLINTNDGDEFKKNLATVSTKTENLIMDSLTTLDSELRYFSTIAGSRTLAMLASFEKGREIIKKILSYPISISIFSYVGPQNKNVPSMNIVTEVPEKTNQPTSLENVLYRSSPKYVYKIKDKNRWIAINENVLTVLIDESSYDLYKLLFNRILSNSEKLGPGSLSSLTDALLFLQEKGYFDLLFLSSQKLSHLEFDINTLAISSSEEEQIKKNEELQMGSKLSIRKLKSHMAMEQLEKYDGECWIGRKCWNYIKKHITPSSPNESNMETKQLSKVCVVPLPHFISYSTFPDDMPKNTSYDNIDNLSYRDDSMFISVASSQKNNSLFRQKDTILLVLLEYKWKMFARGRFFWIFFIHIIYYVSYSTGVLFSRSLYVKGDNKEFDMTHPGHILSLIIMGVSLAVLVGQEIQQYRHSRSGRAYFKSGYNWVDFASFVFPVFTVIHSLAGWNYFSNVCGVATLILWLHGILRLRAFFHFGFTIEIIIQLFRNVFPVILILFIVVIAFTMVLIVMLYLKEDAYFQDNFSGSLISNTTLALGNVTTEGITNSSKVSSDNGFASAFKAFSQVWFFMFGVWDSVNEGKAGDDIMVKVMCILFSLITVLIFFTMLIALMSSTVEEVKNEKEKVWVSNFAAVISEIELLWCSKKEKRNRNNNPSYVYYVANSEAILAQKKKLEKETRQLSQELGIIPNDVCCSHRCQSPPSLFQ